MMISTAENEHKFLEAQVEEIEVLCSIYGNDWKTENESDRSYNIEIKEGDVSVTLYVTLPKTYPFYSPPIFTISAPKIKSEYKQHLKNLLEEVYLYEWIEKIKEYLVSLVLNLENLIDVPEATSSRSKGSTAENQIFDIVHGETIIDRKSTFQGHVAFVASVNEVKNVLNELKKNRKIAHATHNMFAYRINSHAKEHFIEDWDDDGEANAGSRLLHLLQILYAINVLVIVSRWYGGIHLGSVRFSHINNAARQALEEAGVTNNNKRKS